MFVRVKSTPNSPRKSVQIVESIRKNDKVSQKIIRHVGIAMDEREEVKLKDLAIEIIAKIKHQKQLQSSQGTLFPPATELDITSALKNKPGRPKKKQIKDILPTSEVSLDDIVEKERIIEGVHEVIGGVYDEIYGKLLKGKRDNIILKDIVLTRMINPASKHKSQKILNKQFNINHDLDAIYRMMDKVHPKISDIKTRTFNKTKALFPEEMDLVLFDVTTLYFESTTTDELRNFGYSKDHRFNTTQVVLALATNSEGLPIGYELFEGNKAEVKTLIESIQSWKGSFDIGSVCFVGDRAMMSKDNLELLEKNGYKYVIAAKLRSLPGNTKEQILSEDNYRPTVMGNSFAYIGEFDYADRKIIVSYKRKRAMKDAKDRNKILDKIRDKLKVSTSAKGFVNNSGVKKYTNIKGGVTQIDVNKIETDSMWDGFHGVITNIDDPYQTSESILAKYSNLWRIEESFRINKHNLKMRPIFHWKQERIHAHIAICYMSFSLLRYMQYQVCLRQKISLNDMMEELLDVQSSIHIHKITRDLYRLPGKFSNVAKKIYKSFDIVRNLDAEIYIS